MGKGTKMARERTETQLQVILDAMNLYAYSVKIMGNPHRYDPALDFHNETLYMIQRELLHLYVAMRTANKINVNHCPDRAEDRLALQREAMTSADLCFAYFDLARVQFHLHSDKFGLWMSMLESVARKLAAWHKSDMTRYGGKKVPLPVTFDEEVTSASAETAVPEAPQSEVQS